MYSKSSLRQKKKTSLASARRRLRPTGEEQAQMWTEEGSFERTRDEGDQDIASCPELQERQGDTVVLFIFQLEANTERHQIAADIASGIPAMYESREAVIVECFLSEFFFQPEWCRACVTPVESEWDLEASGAKEGDLRTRRDVSLTDRRHCAGGDQQPPGRVDTTGRVTSLVEEMVRRSLDAYIITNEDEHVSEYVSDYDKRRTFISGFSGSAGTAVVLQDGRRALWTDGRYFLTADMQLDCEWLLMKTKEPGVPSMSEWLAEQLTAGARVGLDPALTSGTHFIQLQQRLNKSGLLLVGESTNLVDQVWPEEQRPPRVEDELFVHEIEYSGLKWTKKVAQVREEMKKEEVDLLVLTTLDEVAWLLNLRGNDIPYSTVFRSYLLVDHSDVTLFIASGRIPPVVDFHLHIGQCFDNVCFHQASHDSLVPRLQAAAQDPKVKRVLLPKKYAFSGGASYAIYSAVPAEKRHEAVSPVLLLKARKNEVEFANMKNAHLRDAAAVIDFLAFLEKEINEGREWDEMMAAERLEQFRAEQELFFKPSFNTISAFGPNGAIVHYRPNNETKLAITKDAPYLLDSGGHYQDGTTDVTRTLHFGTPTAFQKEAYTRVLMGALDLARLVFPKGTTDTNIDVLARRHLYKVGLDYKHGTGHGIGLFLSIHESPTQIRIYGDEKHEFELGQFFSDEPGYYKEGEFGVRLETILAVVKAEDLPYKSNKDFYAFETITLVPFEPKFIIVDMLNVEQPYKSNKDFYAFETITLVPFEPKFIIVDMLNVEQCKYLNAYHHRVRTEIGRVLEEQGRHAAHEYMMKRTEPIECSQAGKLEVASRGGGEGMAEETKVKKMPPHLQAASVNSAITSSVSLCLLLAALWFIRL
ncbi:Creatinase N-terminal [Trinorchestia longiramus]|nr:Creatinase N-terminal [Trinorchestia longiramus]